MMAVWFLASSIAQFVGGSIAGWPGTETVGGQVLDPRAALHTSLEVFEHARLVGHRHRRRLHRPEPDLQSWAHGVNDPANHP